MFHNFKSTNPFTKKSKAFTILEMLITVAVVALVTVISVPFISSNVESTRVVTDTSNERSAVEQLTTESALNVMNGVNVNPFGNSQYIYYDATQSEWKTDISTIKPYGKCVTHAGHSNMILRAAASTQANCVELSWVDASGKSVTTTMCGLESNLVDVSFNLDPRPATPTDNITAEVSDTNSDVILPDSDTPINIIPDPVITDTGDNRDAVTAMPPAVSDLAVTFGDRLLNLSWPHSDGATGYIIEISDTGETGPFIQVEDYAEPERLPGTPQESPHKYTISYPIVKNGVTYYVRITPYNESGRGNSSPIRSAMPRPDAPKAPERLRLNPEAGDKFVPLLWDEVYGATGYKVWISTNGTDFEYLDEVTSGTSYNVDKLADKTTDLDNGTTYYFKVTAYVTDNGQTAESADSNIISATPMPPDPGQVTNLRLNPAAGNAQVPLAWKEVEGATGYKIYISTDRVNFTEAKGVTGAESCVIDKLLNNVTYYFKASAYFVDTTSRSGVTTTGKFSAIIEATPTNPPGAVTGLKNTSATPESRRVSLAWDNTSGATGYVVEYSYNGSRFMPFFNDSDDPKERFSLTTNSYVATGQIFGTSNYVKNGTTYYFRVRAYTEENGGRAYGPYSNVISAKPMPPTPPQVTGLKVTGIATGTVSLSWTATTNTTGYDLDYADNSSFTGYKYLDVGTATSKAVTGLNNGTTYYFRVRARNTLDVTVTGAYSATVAGRPLAPPTGVGASLVRSTQVKISWVASAGASGYELQVSKNAAFTDIFKNIDTGTATFYTVPGLTNGTTYYFRVRPRSNVSGTNLYSGYSAGVQGRPLGNVENLRVTASVDRSISIAWNGVTGASGYIVERTGGGGYRSLDTNGTTWTLDAENGVTYTYRVTPYTTVGASVYGSNGKLQGATTVIDAKASPAQVTGLTVTSAVDRTVSLSWSPVYDITRYAVQISEDGYNFRNKVEVVGTTADIGDLNNGQTYWFRVFAFKSTAEGNTDGAVSGVVSARPRPGKVIGFTVAAEGGSTIRFAWNAVSDVSGYQLQCPGYGLDYWPGPATSCDAGGLSRGTEYWFWVRAYSGSGADAVYGDWTVGIPGRTLSAPGTTSFSDSSTTDSSHTFSWYGVDGASGYILHHKNAYMSYFYTYDMGNVTSFTNGGIGASVTHSYKIQAYRDAFDGRIYGGESGQLDLTYVAPDPEPEPTPAPTATATPKPTPTPTPTVKTGVFEVKGAVPVRSIVNNGTNYSFSSGTLKIYKSGSSTMGTLTISYNVRMGYASGTTVNTPGTVESSMNFNYLTFESGTPYFFGEATNFTANCRAGGTFSAGSLSHSSYSKGSGDIYIFTYTKTFEVKP